MSNYNLTNLSDATNILEFAVASNDLTGGVYFVFVMAMVLLVAFVSLKNYDTKSAFTASSFMAAGLAGVLWAVGLIGEGALLVFFVLFVLALGVQLFST